MDTERTSDVMKKSVDIVRAFEPKSDVKFDVHENTFKIFPTPKSKPRTEEELLTYAGRWPGVVEFYKTAPPTMKEKILADAKKDIELKPVGGFGITARTLDGIESFIPGTKEQIDHADGKIVILGNGLSLAAAEILKRFDESARPEIIIVDFIEYGQLALDLYELKKMFEAEKVPFPKKLQEDFDQCKLVIRLIRSGLVKYVRLLLGGEQIPDEVKNAGLVINSHGPAHETQAAQLSLLKPGGKLITNYTFDDESVGEGYHTERLFRSGLPSGTLVTKE